MAKIEIIKEDSSIKVKAPYDKEFINVAHGLAGKWEKPYWVFNVEDESLIRKHCLKIFGDDGLVDQTVTLIVNIEENTGKTELESSGYKLGSKLLLYRIARDESVTFCDGVIPIEGEFKGHGGSAKYPMIGEVGGIILKVRNFPLALYNTLKNKNGITLDQPTDNRKELLEAEKEKLLRRLAEIEDELKEIKMK